LTRAAVAERFTRQTQTLLSARTCGFESHPPYQRHRAAANQHLRPGKDVEMPLSSSARIQPQASRRPPPRWFVRSFWVAQRAVYSATRGRLGLQQATPGHQGMLRLRTRGRRTGEERRAILGYFEDGPNLVTMAMNGWADPEPAWWLNLQANPDAVIDLRDGSRPVRGRAAIGDERARLWARWAEYDRDLDAYAANRSRETAVVIFEPRPEA
jgi:deazaflavin-dependent oxidoreductase (nitroreductase family)